MSPRKLCQCGCGKPTTGKWCRGHHWSHRRRGLPEPESVPRERKPFVPRRPIVVPIGPSIAYVPLTQGQFALIEIEDFAEVAPWNWYAFWMENTKSFSAVRARRPGQMGMHQQLCPRDVGLVPDHKNGNTLDNRRHGNLRPATNQQNIYNSRRRKDNTSGVKGVRFRKDKGVYVAEIKVNGKTKHLICTTDRELAAEAYRKAAVEAAGEFARFA